jgi:hypothetical protein
MMQPPRPESARLWATCSSNTHAYVSTEQAGLVLGVGVGGMMGGMMEIRASKSTAPTGT